MKKYLLVIGCLWMLALAAAAQVNHYYVSPSGSNSNDGSQAHPWQTINKAIASFTLGSSGTTIHVADGIYLESSGSCSPIPSAEALCVNRGGTSNQPLTIQCDNGLNGAAQTGHCTIREASDVNRPQFATIAGVNYVTLQGFDLGGDSTHPATLVQAGILIHGKDGNGNFVQVNQNYIHDISSAANDGNGFGNGCPSEGMVVVNSGGTATTTPTNQSFIGNVLNNGGTLSLPSCNQYHGFYIGGGVRLTAFNNLVGNVPGAGIKVYASVCSDRVSNNTVFHAGWWGILVKDNGNGACASKGLAVGNSTIDNNLAINNGFNHACAGIMQAANSGTNLYSNNLLLGNSPNDTVDVMDTSASCTSTPVSGQVNTLNGSNSSATIANMLVNYQDNGAGDYHLKAGSVAIGAGTVACVSGGLSPCTPTTYFVGLARPTPPSIGIDELSTSATLPPESPTNLTATVQ